MIHKPYAVSWSKTTKAQEYNNTQPFWPQVQVAGSFFPPDSKGESWYYQFWKWAWLLCLSQLSLGSWKADELAKVQVGIPEELYLPGEALR